MARQPQVEDNRGRATIEKFRRAYEKDEAKEESFKEQLKKTLAAALKDEDTAKNISNDMRGKMQRARSDGGADMRALEEARRNTSMNEDNWGNEVTGEEDKYWEEDD